MADKDHEDVWTDTDRTLAKGRAEEAQADPEEFFRAGVFLLKKGRTKEALGAFRRAFELKGAEPRYMSYFGYCLAAAANRAKEGLALCEKAVAKEFYRAELFLNLGRAYLVSGNRRKAHNALRKGLSIERDNVEIRKELERMGVRKPPVFPFLDRRSPLNKIAGKVLHRLRIR